jgi:hypothetical protein
LFESGCHGLLGDLGIVARLGFGGRDIADGLEEAPMVEPVDPFQGGKLDRFDTAPGTTPADHLGLVEAVDGFGEGIDAPMSVKQFLMPAAVACKDG